MGDFQVCQPSLEQVFNRFATTQISQASSQQQPAVVSDMTAKVAPADSDETIAAMTIHGAGRQDRRWLASGRPLVLAHRSPRHYGHRAESAERAHCTGDRK